MDKLYSENPVLEYLDQKTKEEALAELEIIPLGTPMTKPCLAYKQTLVRIPQNLLLGTDYALGGYKVSQQPNSLTNNVQLVLRTLNTVQEVLSFITLYQIPSISQNQALDLEENKKLKEILQEHLKKQIEQLEANRKNIHQDITSIENLAKKEYETLYEHQNVILNILNENKNSEELKQLKERILALELEFKASLDENQDQFLKELQEIRENTKSSLKEITDLVKDLNNKL